ncbi:MAG: hypothetical protein RLZZ135_1551 [Cyanobacteriota bacterium]
MISRLFHNRVFSCLFTVPVVLTCLSFLTIPTHSKDPEQLTNVESWLITPNPDLHKLAIDRDYVGFAVYQIGSVLPHALFAVAFLGNSSSDRHKKNKN